MLALDRLGSGSWGWRSRRSLGGFRGAFGRLFGGGSRRRLLLLGLLLAEEALEGLLQLVDRIRSCWWHVRFVRVQGDQLEAEIVATAIDVPVESTPCGVDSNKELSLGANKDRRRESMLYHNNVSRW